MNTPSELKEGYDSSVETTHIATSFPPLFGISFYDSRPIRSGDDPDSYHLKELYANKLGWHWYMRKTMSQQMVRAFKATHPYRLLGVAVGAGKCAMEIPAGRYIVTDERLVWSLSAEEFFAEYAVAVPLEKK